MRIFLAILAAMVFAVYFSVTYLLLRTVSTVGDPARAAAMVADSGVYDFAYDRALDAALNDLTDTESRFEGGAAGDPQSITLADPEAAAAVLKDRVETLVPRIYLQAQVREALDQLMPYAIGQVDAFTLEADIADRIRSAPAVVRGVTEEVDIGRILATQVLAPYLVKVTSNLQIGRFGVVVTEAEARAAALQILPPRWTHDAIVAVVDELAPFVAGDTDAFVVRIPLRDRAVAVGEALKGELASEAAAGNLVFSALAGPAISRHIGKSVPIGYGVELSAEEIIRVVGEITPANRLVAEASHVIDRATAYLTGDSEDLSITIDLTDWERDAVAVLSKLAGEKVRQAVRSLPPCNTPKQISAAVAHVAAQRLPRCAGPEAEALVPSIMPLVRERIEQIAADLPHSVTYTDAMSRQELGPDRVRELENSRERVVNGIVFDEQDLLAWLSRNGEPQGRAEAETTLERIRGGFRFTGRDWRRMAGDSFDRVQSFRRTARFALRYRYALYALGLGLLLAVAFAGGRSWRGRAMWAGGVLCVVSAALLLTLMAAETAGAVRIEAAADDTMALDQEFRLYFPRLALLVDSGGVTRVAVRGWHAVAGTYRTGVIPFLVAGAAVFLLGAALAAVRWRTGRETRPNL